MPISHPSSICHKKITAINKDLGHTIPKQYEKL